MSEMRPRGGLAAAIFVSGMFVLRVDERESERQTRLGASHLKQPICQLSTPFGGVLFIRGKLPLEGSKETSGPAANAQNGLGAYAGGLQNVIAGIAEQSVDHLERVVRQRVVRHPEPGPSSRHPNSDLSQFGSFCFR